MILKSLVYHVLILTFKKKEPSINLNIFDVACSNFNIEKKNCII